MRGPGLAATDDPRELIPGSLTALYDDAADLRLHARGLEKASAEVTRNDVPSWLGDAAAGWGDRRPALAAQLDVPVEVYRVCADALEAHARVIELARELVEVAIALWERGATAVSFAGGMCEPLGVGLGGSGGGVLGGVGLGGSGLGAPWTSALGRSLRQQAAAARAQVVPPAGAGGGGAELCAQAERILAALRAMVDRSVSALAELLDACCLDMPDGRFHLGSYFAGLGDWLYGIGELCVRFSTPRLILDGDAYIADGEAMIDGWRALAEHLAANPHDANRLLLDSETFRDDPGRWFGRLAPDVALTVLGVPAVGKAAKLATLGRGARILDDLEEVEDLLGDGRTLDDVAESADDVPDPDQLPAAEVPNDWREAFEALTQGNSRGVAVVGSERELRQFFDAVTEGAEPLAAPGGKVTEVYRLSDGTRAQWRISSATGGPTVDFFPPVGKDLKIHVGSTE